MISIRINLIAKGELKMLKIKLFCAGGMSTSILVKKMLESAEKKGIAVEIAAYPEAQMDQQTDDCDIALL